MARETLIPQLIDENSEAMLEEWVVALKASTNFREDLIGDRELRYQCKQFVTLLRQASREGDVSHIEGPAWQSLRDHLAEMSRSWVQLGFKPSDVADFVMLFKQPLLEKLARHLDESPRDMIGEIATVNGLLDRLGLWTAEVFQQSQARIIKRQQSELMELSTPVVSLWDGVLALPLIGTLDSSRTQVVMESLLEKIVEYEAGVAILDITGVPTVDTLVAQHLIKAVTAARLMGAECIISGIRPSIAQTMVQLGIDLRDVTTKATLADAFRTALKLIKAKDQRPGLMTPDF